VIVLAVVSLVVVVIEVIGVTIACLVLVDFVVSVPYVTVLFGNLIAFLYVCSITQQYNVHVDTGNGS